MTNLSLDALIMSIMAERPNLNRDKVRFAISAVLAFHPNVHPGALVTQVPMIGGSSPSGRFWIKDSVKDDNWFPLWQLYYRFAEPYVDAMERTDSSNAS